MIRFVSVWSLHSRVEKMDWRGKRLVASRPVRRLLQ